MITSQILTYSGELEAAIGSDYGLNYFLAPLSTLNARDNFSLNLMHMPTPKWPEDLTEAELKEIGKRYLQCAGTAEAMTCEISKVVGGQQILFTIGHSALPEGEPLVPVTYHFGEATTYVYPTELFDAEEAADLFFSYHQTQDIPAGYHLRRRSLRGTIANTAPKVNPTAPKAWPPRQQSVGWPSRLHATPAHAIKNSRVTRMSLRVEPRGSLPEARVLEIELSLGMQLPETYRTWIRSTNGGPVHPQPWVPQSAGPGLITKIDSIDNLTEMRGYESHHAIPLEYLIVSLANGGSLTIKIRGDDYGSAWWADLDKAEDEGIGEGPSESIMARLADDWDAFLALEFEILAGKSGDD